LDLHDPGAIPLPGLTWWYLLSHRCDPGEKGWQYFRLCFAAVDDDVVEKYTKSCVEAFHSFWAKKKVCEIDEILNDEEIALLGAMQLSSCQDGFAFSPMIC